MESYILLEKNKRDYNEVYMEAEIKRLVDQEKFKRELAQYTKFKPFWLNDYISFVRFSDFWAKDNSYNAILDTMKDISQ